MEDRPSPQALQPFVPGVDTDPCLLGCAGLGPIPLDHQPPQVQQEDVTLVEAVPGELHLRGPGSGRILIAQIFLGAGINFTSVCVDRWHGSLISRVEQLKFHPQIENLEWDMRGPLPL